MLRNATIAIAVALVVEVASAQTRLWIVQVGTSGSDDIRGLAPDGFGGVYATGLTTGSLGGPFRGGFSDAWLARYDRAGNRDWIVQFGTNREDVPQAAAPDGMGGVYVVGTTEGALGEPNAGLYDAFLVRYDADGTQNWVRQLGTAASDFAIIATPDGGGGVYIAGGTEGNLGGQNAGGGDAWVARYDESGNQLWVRQFGTIDNEGVSGAAPDEEGSVYLVGTTGGSLFDPRVGASDAFVVRYDSAGVQVWGDQFGTTSSDLADAAVPDGASGVYVTGLTNGNLGGPPAGLSDAFVVHYGPNGTQSWIRQFGSSSAEGNPHANAAEAAPDGVGGVYMVGSTRGSLGGQNAGQWDAWVTRFEGAGSQTWISQFGTADWDEANAAASDGARGVYVGGATLGSFGRPNAGQWDGYLARYAMRLAGDLDGDCQVDLSDLATLLSHFGTPGGATSADGDLDGDGDVDLSDLAALLAAFGTVCP